MTEEQVRQGKIYLDEIKALANKKLNWEQSTRYNEESIIGWCGAGSCRLDMSFMPFSHLRELAICHYEKRIKELTKELEAL